MTAVRVSIDEVQAPRRRVHPLVGMGVHLALLQDSVDSFRNCWEEFMASPFVTAEPDHPIIYAGDEDDVPVPAGEEEA